MSIHHDDLNLARQGGRAGSIVAGRALDDSRRGIRNGDRLSHCGRRCGRRKHLRLNGCGNHGIRCRRNRRRWRRGLGGVSGLRRRALTLAAAVVESRAGVLLIALELLPGLLLLRAGRPRLGLNFHTHRNRRRGNPGLPVAGTGIGGLLTNRTTGGTVGPAPVTPRNSRTLLHHFSLVVTRRVIASPAHCRDLNVNKKPLCGCSVPGTGAALNPAGPAQKLYVVRCPAARRRAPMHQGRRCLPKAC